jgi:hypothetical protein
MPDLAAATRATTGCGSCEDEINGVVSWLAGEERAGGETAGEVAAGAERPAGELADAGIQGEEVVVLCRVS